MAERELRGQVALVTGAARRIGRHIALALAAEGMDIVIHYNRSEAQARELQETIQEWGSTAWTLQANFRDEGRAHRVIERAADMAGRLDLLVNNAASFDAEQVPELTFETMVDALAVDAWAPFALSRDFCERIGHGMVINLIDSRVTDYDFNHTGYILAKHVLLKMTEMLALQYAPQVQVNGILPGLILPPPHEDAAYLDALTDTVPLKRHGDPDDVAAAAVFLAKSTFMTGAMIHVDGGRRLKEYGHGSSYPHQ
ncbi:MAG: SDR family oxidoreductase [Armatimonadia bacterium]